LHAHHAGSGVLELGLRDRELLTGADLVERVADSTFVALMREVEMGLRRIAREHSRGEHALLPRTVSQPRAAFSATCRRTSSLVARCACADLPALHHARVDSERAARSTPGSR